MSRGAGALAAYQTLAAKVTDLDAGNQRLRAENSELRQRVDTYAQTIYRLAAQLHQTRTAQPTPGKVVPLRNRSS